MDKYMKSQELKAKALKMERESLDKLFPNEFDIPYTPTPDDILVTQYLRPNGEKRIVYAPIGKDYVQKAKNMVCSAEELRTGEIVLYLRWDFQTDEQESLEFATNGPGDNSPTEVLKKMINRLWEKN